MDRFLPNPNFKQGVDVFDSKWNKGFDVVKLWICDIIVTYSLPVLLTSIGLSGVFGLYAIVCVIAWVFVFLKVPETKGMPLEVITEFFAVGAKQIAATKNN